MKTINQYNTVLAAIGFTLLITSLAACDQCAESNIETVSTNETASTEINTANNAGNERDSKSAETAIVIDTDGYSAGHEFGSRLALKNRQQPDFDLEEAFRGMIDALLEVGSRVNVAEVSAALEEFNKHEAANSKSPQIMARTRGFKDDFAALNARREGVVVLPSGVQYEVLKAGNGKQPADGDAVLVSYQASLTNGVVFDTTYEDGEPLHMTLNEIAVPGLREALLLMNEGAQWRVVIPPSMGFGRSGNNQLRRRDLIYEIELVSIEKAQESKR